MYHGIPLMERMFGIMDRECARFNDACARAGVSPVSVSQWRRGIMTPRVDSVDAILGALGYRLVLRESNHPFAVVTIEGHMTSRLVALAKISGRSLRSICFAAGVHKYALGQWSRKPMSARLDIYIAVASVLGYTLVIRQEDSDDEE